MALHEDKFELLIHKQNPNSYLYELPFVIEKQTYEVSTMEICFIQLTELKISASLFHRIFLGPPMSAPLLLLPEKLLFGF